MRISKKAKEELLAKYGNDSTLFNPLDAERAEYIRKATAFYITFENHDNQHGYCECCQAEIEVPKSKHREMITCPNCGKQMQVLHKWRSKNNWRMDWMVVPQTINGYTIALRYFATIHTDELNIKNLGELAREIINFNTKQRYEMEYDNHVGWFIGRPYHFLERTMYMYRKNCCLQGRACEVGLFEELRKLDCFKHFTNIEELWDDKDVYVTSHITCLGKRASLYEKLIKVGLIDFVKKDWNTYFRTFYWREDAVINFDDTQTSLIKMLKLNKTGFNFFLQHPNAKILAYLQENNTEDTETLNMIVKTSTSNDDKATLTRYKIKVRKAIGYCYKQHIAMAEYLHYIDCLNRLNYPLDNAYVFPKNFRDADLRIAKEMMGDDYSEQNIIIEKLSNALRNMDGLKEFMDGSNGLLVSVPENSWDLQHEGIVMHNCIGNYVNRMAEGKTLIFFVRKLNDPTAPFVAFEYCNGEIIQCRYDYNEAVSDNTEEGAKILDFVDKFAEQLRKNNVLYKAA